LELSLGLIVLRMHCYCNEIYQEDWSLPWDLEN
jgi:hypothetical protein